MFITETILRLRARCPSFERRVAGTASFEAATEQGATFNVPNAYVIAVEETARDADGSSNAQQMRLTFIVVVCVDNTQSREDGRGLTGGQKIERIRRELLNALIGWEPIMWSTPQPKIIPGYEDLMPNSRADTVRYRGSSFLKITDGRLWHQFEWSVDYMDSKCETVDLERTQVCGVVTNGVIEIVPQYLPTADTAVVTNVTVETGASTPEIEELLDGMDRVPSTLWTFDPETGNLQVSPRVPESSRLCATYEVEMPRYYELLRQLYAEYQPAVLAEAGGDPNAITADMYDLVQDVPPDAIIDWRPHDGSNREPTFSTGIPEVQE